MLLYFAFAAIFVAFVSAEVIQPKDESLNFSDCEGTDAGLGYVFAVTSQNFSKGQDVVLKKGGTYEFTMTFEACGESKSLKPVVYGVIGGNRMPWNEVGTDACANLVGSNKCPLKDKGIYTYSVYTYIRPEYPEMAFYFLWILDGDETRQICFQMPAKISK